uniref:Uncharacterized protein n=1 Tax=Solanum tuberosum TaxID=4113 RepID=M1A3M3_SOLTU
MLAEELSPELLLIPVGVLPAAGVAVRLLMLLVLPVRLGWLLLLAEPAASSRQAAGCSGRAAGCWLFPSGAAGCCFSPEEKREAATRKGGEERKGSNSTCCWRRNQRREREGG